MRLRKVAFKALSQDVQSFLAGVLRGQGLRVEDEQGRTVATVLPATEGPATAYVDATPAEREQAWQEIRKIQRKTGRALKKHGISEADVVKEILKDD